MRTLPPQLETALANQQGELILRVNTWTDAADYNAKPDNPDHVWIVKAFTIEATSASAELVTENDYTLSAFTVFTIERGVLLAGVEYTIESGLMHVRKYTENYGRINITGSSYPNQKISIAGDDTYRNVIEAFCTAIGKTAIIKEGANLWPDYQFLPAGKILSLNKAEQFESLLRQKYCILVYEQSPNLLLFYNLDSFDYNSANSYTSGVWAAELSLFVSISEDGNIATSPNGINWTPRTSPIANRWIYICWSEELSLLVAVAISGTISDRIITSPDGINWTTRAAPVLSNWSAVTWSPALSLFVAVATNGNTQQIITSPDGINWTLRTGVMGSSGASGVCWSPALNLFVAVGAGTGKAMTSPDGINWTLRTGPSNTYADVCWSPTLNLFAAVAPGTPITSNVMTSPDGTTWTARTGALLQAWRTVIWADTLNLFIATADDSGIAQPIMTSPNGITWTARTIPTTTATWESVCWSPELSLLVAIGTNTNNECFATSPDGITWTIRYAPPILHDLNYLDGPTSYIDRQQAEVHFLWRDEIESLHVDGDTNLPQWNLGFLESTDSPPTTRQDPYYKIFLQKAPVRLDLTDSDKIHFTPYWSIDPTQTIDAMMQVTEHLNLTKSPAWYQEIRSIVLFDKTEGGALPSTIERVAAYTPLVSTGFDGNLTPAVNNLQALAQAVDDLDVGEAVSNANDVWRVGESPGGTSAWVGTFTAAGSSGSTIKYGTTSGTAAAMSVTATTQLAKMRLYNTTRGNSVLISNWVAGTITSVANYPAGWTNGDVLTIASQTVSGGSLGWCDIEITSGNLLNKSQIFLYAAIRSATVNDAFVVHPFETYAASKSVFTVAQVSGTTMVATLYVKLISNVVAIAWTGTPLRVYIREAGYTS